MCIKRMSRPASQMKLPPFPQARLQLTRRERTPPSGSSARAVPAGVSAISFDTLDSTL